MSSKLVDTEPGGEQTQYESIRTESEPHARSQGQLGNTETPSEAKERADAEKRERGEKTAENLRYGQTISEGGYEGKTTEITGSASQSGYGAQDARDADQNIAQSRREQGYGPGSGVGA